MADQHVRRRGSTREKQGAKYVCVCVYFAGLLLRGPSHLLLLTPFTLLDFLLPGTLLPLLLL